MLELLLKRRLKIIEGQNKMTELVRTAVKEKAKQMIKLLKKEYPDYNYLRELFREIRTGLGVAVDRDDSPTKLPYIPTEEEIARYYEAVWKSRDMKHVAMVKTLIYTGVRVSEMINIKISDIDFEQCQIKIMDNKKKKERKVPFPNSFKEVLAIYVENVQEKKGIYLFESSWKKAYSDRAIRKILAKYTKLAGIEQAISPRKIRHFLFNWLKKQGIDDALIQPYSGHQSKQGLEIYTKLTIKEAQAEYNNNIDKLAI
jgi:integrase/recombinase XerD